MKGSTRITIVVAIGIACLIGGSLANDGNAYKSDDNATTPENAFLSKLTKKEGLEEPSNFLLSVESTKIWTRPFTAENASSIETEITDSSDFNSKFTKKEYDVDFTYDCSNKRIYILKTKFSYHYFPRPDRVLDVIQYDGSNKFQRIKRVSNMFDKAQSIACDWTTGNIYWIEYIEEQITYAIKVTNKLFDEPKYVVQPSVARTALFSALEIENILVYPKKNEIFFLINQNIWYTSNALNSTPHLLFPSMKRNYIFRIVIDYALDKLYWNNINNISCVNISDSTRPFNLQSIDTKKASDFHYYFTVYNNTYYWFVGGNNEYKLYMENGNKSERVEYDLEENYNLVYKFSFKFFSPNCSCQSEESEHFLLTYHEFTISIKPYVADKTSFMKYNITDSPNFKSNEYELDLTSDCSNKRIYILKTFTPHEDYPNADRVLDVIQYDDNNKFQRIQRIFNMFNRAVSIASDWTTENIYWIENIKEDTFAIKVTNKLFDEPKYVIQPTKGNKMDDIIVYPKTNELFFLFNESIWYTSNSPDSTAHLLFSSLTSSTLHRVQNLVIDYALDKLCWIAWPRKLRCVKISDSTRPFKRTFIVNQRTGPIDNRFTVFNNTYYWIVGKEKVFYMKDDNKTKRVKSKLDAKLRNLFFFSPIC